MHHFSKPPSGTNPRPHRHRYRVHFERLEERLPPGDLLLGSALGVSWLGYDLGRGTAQPALTALTSSRHEGVGFQRAREALPTARPWQLASATPVAASIQQAWDAGNFVATLAITQVCVDDLFAAVLNDPLHDGNPFAAVEQPSRLPVVAEDSAAARADRGGPTPWVKGSPVTNGALPAAVPFLAAAQVANDLTWFASLQLPAAPQPDAALPEELLNRLKAAKPEFQGFTGGPGGGTSSSAGNVFLYEWTIPTPNSVPHDIIADDEGIIWFTEQQANKIGRFTWWNEEFMEFTIPTANSGPHGLCVAPDYGIWFTEQQGNKIARIDRATFAFTEYALPNPNSGPHTPIHDGYGRVWFTEQSGNRIGRINVFDGTLEEWTLPRTNSGPYGIVPDFSGNGWFCEFGSGSNRIGRIDAETGAITEYSTPTTNSGPRRLWFDLFGQLWITENRGNKLGMFNPFSETFREWNTPHAGGQPYAITVDYNHLVWFTEFSANYMVRFDPFTEEMTSFAMPTTRELVRFIYVDIFNFVWYENNGNNAIGVVLQW